MQFKTFSFRIALMFSMTMVLMGLALLGVFSWVSADKARSRLAADLAQVTATAALKIDGDLHQRFTHPQVWRESDWREVRDYLERVADVNGLSHEHVYTFQYNPDKPNELAFAVMLHKEPFVGDVYRLPEVNQDLARKVAEDGVTRTTGVYQDQHGRWISALAPIQDHDGRVVGLLEADHRMNTFSQAFFAAWGEELFPFLLAMLIMSPLVFALAWWAARTVSEPIKKLVEVTEFTSQGHWDHPIPLMKYEELDRLSCAFERMRLEISRKMTELETLNQDLEETVADRTNALQELFQRLTVVQEIIVSVNEMTRLEDVLLKSGEAVARLAPIDNLVLMLPHDKGSVEVFSLVLSEKRVDYSFRDMDGPVLDKVGGGELSLSDRARICDVLEHENQFRSIFPLMVDEKLVGVLILGKQGEEPFDEKAVNLFEGLLMHIAAAVQKTHMISSLSRLNQDLKSANENLKTRTEAELAYRKTHDQITELGNRLYFQDQLTLEVARAQIAQKPFGVLTLDLDRFKKVNDHLGVEMGDRILREVGQRLIATLKDTDILARVSGNEFSVVLPGLYLEQDAGKVAQKLLAEVSQPFYMGSVPVHLSASIGVATYPEGCENPESLAQNAAIALSSAKTAGGDCFKFYDASMDSAGERRLLMENAMRQALEEDQFVLNYQPQVRIGDGRVIGMEALLRWTHPELGFISPGEFIPLAEDTGLIVPIDWWVLRRVARQIRTWLDQGLPVVPVAVNLSGRQFQRADLIDFVQKVITETNIKPEYLELEITESVTMHDVQATVKTLAGLKNMGICISIDDFGTGYSSLSYLKQFAIDRLKIDQSFIRDLPANEEDSAIATAVIDLGHALGLLVIAEGVEDESQLEFLKSRHCDEYQGYYYSRPVDAESMGRLLEETAVDHMK